MSEAVRQQLPARFRPRCRVVGDLMADLSSFARAADPLPEGEWIGLLPGSKPAKLSVGMPFLLDTADRLARLRPGCRFLLPIAPPPAKRNCCVCGSDQSHRSPLQR